MSFVSFVSHIKQSLLSTPYNLLITSFFLITSSRLPIFSCPQHLPPFPQLPPTHTLPPIHSSLPHALSLSLHPSHTPSLTHSFTHLFTHSFTHSLTHSNPPIHSLTRSLTRPPTHPSHLLFLPHVTRIILSLLLYHTKSNLYIVCCALCCYIVSLKQ